MQKNSYFIERIVGIIGFLFLLLAFISSFFVPEDSNSILEYFTNTQTVVHIVHGICAAICFVLIFKPSITFYLIILFSESILTILTNYESMGIFFFYSFLILAFLKGYFKKNMTIKFVISFFIHISSIILSFPHGWINVYISLGTSVFFFVFHLWIIKILKEQYSCFLPEKVSNSLVLSNVRKGDEISLTEYGLTGRQISLVIDYIYNQSSYKDLSQKYSVGISTVKREFSIVFRIFGVSKIDELKMLLLQYQIKE